MLIGYDACNALRLDGPLGDYSRNLIASLADSHVKDFRAILFCTHINDNYSRHFSGYSNISTYLPAGGAKMMPEVWLRYHLNTVLRQEKVQLMHGLNEELPYHIGREVKTVVTCYGTGQHHNTSLPDSMLWRTRMKYAFSAADVVVAVSEAVRESLLANGVSEGKVVVIGDQADPMRVTPAVAEQYRSLYSRLLGK
ncbi:MAG: glycosyltransferase [Bacteroidales bacterium]|nr:glycosyltransferase [Bacteroidales bacterium]